MKSDKRVGYKFRGPLSHTAERFEELFSMYHALGSASQEVVNEARNVVPTRAYEPTSHKSVKTREERGGEIPT